MNRIKKYVTPEFAFALYLFLFSFLKPLVTLFEEISTLILLIVVCAFIVGYFLICKLRFDATNLRRYIVFMLCMCVIFLINWLFYNNSVLPSYIYDFCIYGAIPIFLLINVCDYSKLLKYWCSMAVAVGVLFIVDPFVGYLWSGGYMPFGFNQMLPAVCGAGIWFFYYKKLWAVPFLLVFFAEIVIYANKGATLAAVLFMLVLLVLFGLKKDAPRNKKAILYRAGMVVGAVLVLAVLMGPILNLLWKICDAWGINSYALNSLRFAGGLNHVIEVRRVIWSDVLEACRGNWLLGEGIGAYQAQKGIYPHNVFLEILNASGVFATAIFIAACVFSVYAGVKNPGQRDSESRCMFILLYFVIWFFPMMISLTMWSYAPFWVYWGISLYGQWPKSLSCLKNCWRKGAVKIWRNAKS